MKYTIGIVSMIQNEARWLREWVEYYRLIGVERFYLYDHLSTDQPELILADYIASGIVSLQRVDVEVVDFQLLQIHMFQQGIELARVECQWVALLDSDEFIVPKTTTSLPEFLRSYEHFGGLVVNWMMHGTSGVAEVPMNELMIETLTKRGPRNLHHNRHVKTIAQTRYVTGTTSQHFVKYVPGYYAVNADGHRVDGPFDATTPVDKIQINHYFNRDQKYLMETKIRRRIRMKTDPETLLAWEREMNTEVDTSIQRFVEPLRVRLGMSTWFDYEKYLQYNPDVVAAGYTTPERAVWHWLNQGWRDGRKYM